MRERMQGEEGKMGTEEGEVRWDGDTGEEGGGIRGGYRGGG